MANKLLIAALAFVLETGHAVAQDRSGDLAIIVAQGSSLENVSSQELIRIFEEEKNKDPDGHKIIVTIREPGAPERATALKMIYKMDEGEFSTYFLRAVFAGRAYGKPTEFNSGRTLREYVAATPGAIGFVRASEADDKVKIIKVDGKAPGDSDYPLKIK